MTRQLGVLLSAALVALQWVFAASLISQSFIWWMKAAQPQVSAGVVGAVTLAFASAGAIGYSVWAYEKFGEGTRKWKFAALLITLAGLAGLLVLFGLYWAGLLVLERR